MSEKTAATEPKAAPANRLKQCACLTGTDEVCKSTTRKAFAQGHDARMSSRLAQAVAAGGMTEADAVATLKEAGGGLALISKTTHSARLRAARAAGGGDKPVKAAKPKVADSPEAAIQAAGPTVMGTKVVVWHGKRKFDAVVVRNATEELVARHRLQSKSCDHEVQVEQGADGKPEVFTK